MWYNICSYCSDQATHTEPYTQYSLYYTMPTSQTESLYTQRSLSARKIKAVFRKRSCRTWGRIKKSTSERKPANMTECLSQCLSIQNVRVPSPPWRLIRFWNGLDFYFPIFSFFLRFRDVPTHITKISDKTYSSFVEFTLCWLKSLL